MLIKGSGFPLLGNIFSTSKAGMTTYLKHILFILVIIIIAACGNNEDEYKVVDFSKHTLEKKNPEHIIEPNTLKVAIGAMISPVETMASYQSLLDYIGRKLNLKVELIQRETYAEINEMIPTKQIDIAFICTGPYVVGKGKYGFEGLVCPVVKGEPFYQAYLIVNKNSPYEKLEDLKGRSFAFTDPESNTGDFVPKYWLFQINETPDSFFSKIIFTHSHDNSIMAVAKSMVDGASVNSMVWEYFNTRDPIYTSQTKVIKKSEKFGSPPLVASQSLSQELKSKIIKLLCEMNQDPEGRKILEALMIDSFRPTDDSWYETVKQMNQALLQAKAQGKDEKKH
jgi:phosphonate transport system substrate-binding protein